MPLTRRTLMIAALATPPTRALAQPATPADPDASLAEHVDWVVSLFDGGATDLTVADVEARFDANFRSLVPPEELIATLQSLASELGPIELVEDQSSAADEFIGLYRSASGDGVMISIAIDPKTGLISGFFITPAPLPEGTPVASAVATTAATPVASPSVQIDVEAQVAQYADMLAAIRAVGEPAVAAVLTSDDATLAPLLSDEMAATLDSASIADVMSSYTTRQITMTFAEAGAHLFGQWNDDTIAGLLVQNGASFPYQLHAGAPQQGKLPKGEWTGEVATLGLDIVVTFEIGETGDLAATLDIPQQGIEDAVMVDLRYRAEQPVGDLQEERVFAPGGANDSYTAEFAWGEARLQVTIAVDIGAGTVAALQVLPVVPLPSEVETPSPLVADRLPFDGTWWVFWGGETELQNYHAVTASQRHAYDIVIWKDGATYRDAGASNADYWAWGQPVLAPIGGEVVEALSDEEDLSPNLLPQDRDGSRNPGGNHVVIRVSDTEYVFIAHMQRGMVRVQPGDRVAPGDLLGLCGNSGNTSEPHIHIHAQTTPAIEDLQARGIPIQFADILVDGRATENALPVQGTFIANP